MSTDAAVRTRHREPTIEIAGVTPVGALTSPTVTRQRVEAIVFGPMEPALRNHLITLGYVDLANAMADLLGEVDANWYAITVWPSFTAGQVIRGGQGERVRKASERLHLPSAWGGRLATRLERRAGAKPGIVNRSMAAGNRGVFYEVAVACADFLHTFGDRDPDTADHDDEQRRLEEFGARVLGMPHPPGRVWPEGRRDRLRDGFRAFLDAMHTDDQHRKAQLILLGNLLIGDHEQRRVQGWLDLMTVAPLRGLTARFDDTTTRNRGIAVVERMFSRFATKKLQVLEMAGETLPLGHPIPPHETSGGSLFPPPLDVLDPDVDEVFTKIDDAAPGGDGAERWNDYDSRMAYIATLFRSRQHSGLIGLNPYSTDEMRQIYEQAAEIDRFDERAAFEGPLMFADMTADLESPWPADVTARFRDTLAAARQRGDVEADSAIEEFYRPSGRPPRERFYTDALLAISRPDSGENTGPLAQFLSAPPVLPTWADMDKIERAQRFYRSYRSAAHIGLFFGSMPLSYAGSKGCQVLGVMSTLNQNPERRMWESAKFLEDVFLTPFWEAGSEGYQSIRGVRLFHASVRHTILCDSKHIVDRPPELGGLAWDPDWGIPICQEDLLAGAFDFALGAVHVMDRFGVAADRDDIEAYVHAWLVVGTMLGVEPELFESPVEPGRPFDPDEAFFAARTTLYRQLGPTAAGRRLMDALTELMDDWFPGPLKYTPRAFLYAAFPESIRQVLGLPPTTPGGNALVRVQSWGRSWRTNRAYTKGFGVGVRFVGDRWLEWWEREYQEVPPYRRGGAPQVIERMPPSVLLTIQSYGEIEDIATELAGSGVAVHQRPALDDDGFESIGLTTLLDLTATVAADMRRTIKRLRDTTVDAVNIRRAEVTVDGRTMIVGQLTDDEIDALFPDQ